MGARSRTDSSVAMPGKPAGPAQHPSSLPGFITEPQKVLKDVVGPAATGIVDFLRGKGTGRSQAPAGAAGAATAAATAPTPLPFFISELFSAASSPLSRF